MTTAWFIVPIVGDGKSPSTAFAATLSSEVTSHVAVIATNQSGAPKFSWALVQANGNGFTTLAATSGVFQIPSPTLSLFGTLTAGQQQVVTQACTAYSIAVSPTAVQTVVSVINNIGRAQEPAFDVSKFVVVQPNV